MPRHIPSAVIADPLTARRPGIDRPRAVHQDQPFLPLDLPSGEGSGVEQVIVTTALLEAAFAELAEHDTFRGIPTVVRTVEWIDEHYRGVDRPSRVRSFLRDAYDKWGTTNAVLGADAERIPMRHVTWLGEDLGTDLYYECLDREWNEDGDAEFGEPLPSTLLEGTVNDVTVGPDGKVWIATYVGVAYLEGGEFTVFDLAHGLPSDGVLSVDVAPDGTVWVGTTNGAARWDGGDEWTPFHMEDGLPGFQVPEIAVRGTNDVWLGTNGGLAHWNGTSFEAWTTAQGLPSPLVSAIAFDGDDVWCATAGGAARLTGSTFSVFNTSNSGLLSNWVIAVTVDDAGRVWFGHSDNYFAQGGVSRFDGVAWFTDALPAYAGLSVRSLCVEPTGDEYWAATEAGLLHRGPSIDELLTAADGLAGSDLFALDRHGSIGLLTASNVGLSMGLPGSWTTYTKDNGLPVADLDYDEIDLYPDLVVGRIPARDPQQVATYVQKLRDYQSGSYGADATSALLLGEVLFGGSDGKDLCLQAKAELPPAFSMTELYEIDGNQDRALALAAWENGPGIVVHVGHGSYDLMGVGSGLELLFNTDLRLLDTGGRAGLVIGYSCNSGGFDQETSMEQLLFNANGGAVATIANTRESVASLDALVTVRMLEILFASDHGEPALALHERRRELVDANPNEYRIETWSRRMYLIRSYLGSPTLSLWRETPKTMLVAHAPAAPSFRAAFPVVVTDFGSGLPVAGALVCVSKGFEDYAYGRTGADGTVTFDFRPETVGTIDVRVSAPDYAPIASTAIVSPVMQPNPVAAGWQRVDVASLRSPHAWQLKVAIRNAGTASAAGWSVQLECDDPRVSVAQGASTLPALASGATAWTSALDVTVSGDVGDGDAIAFRLVGTGPVSFVEEYSVTAAVPDLVFLDMVVDGSAIRPRVVNRGTRPTGPVSATIAPVDGLGSVIDGTASAPALAPGQTAVFPDGFEISGPGSARFTLTLDDGLGHVRTQSFDREAPEGAPGITALPRAGGSLLRWTPSDSEDLAGYRVLREGAGGTYTDVFGDLLREAAIAEVAVPSVGTRRFVVVAIDSSGNASPDSASVTAHAQPPMLAGWPQRLSSIVGPSPMIAADLDGDGSKEILFGTMWEADAVHVFHHDGAEWSDGDGDAETNGIFGKTDERVHAAPLAVDIDGDGSREIFAASFDYSVHAWSSSGSMPSVLPGWPVAATSAHRSSPVAGDFDGDGQLEIVTLALQGLVRVLEADGTMVPGWPRATATHGLASTPAVADLNDDGKDDVVFAANDSLIYVISGNGVDFPGWPIHVGAPMQSSPVLADVDGDGDLEIFAIDKVGRCWGFHHDDRDVIPGPDPLPGWPITFQPFSGFPHSPAVADLDNDGSPEFVINGHEEIVVVHVDGTPFPGFPLDTGVEGSTSPIVADVNGDGTLDIIVGSKDRRLTAYDRQGAVVGGWPIEFGEIIQSTPFVSDVDGDGDLDLVVGADDFQVRVFDLPTLAIEGAAPWPGYHGGADLRGVYTPVTYDPTFVEPIAGHGFGGGTLTLLPSAPNPFRGRTELRFALPASGTVTVEIFDVTGRRIVAPVARAHFEAGRHAVTWDGRDEGGRAVASGVYFVRLTAGGDTRRAKVLRIR